MKTNGKFLLQFLSKLNITKPLHLIHQDIEMIVTLLKKQVKEQKNSNQTELHVERVKETGLETKVGVKAHQLSDIEEH